MVVHARHPTAPHGILVRVCAAVTCACLPALHSSVRMHASRSSQCTAMHKCMVQRQIAMTSAIWRAELTLAMHGSHPPMAPPPMAPLSPWHPFPMVPTIEDALSSVFPTCKPWV